MNNSQLTFHWPWFNLSMSSKVDQILSSKLKGHVWLTICIYKLLVSLVFHTNFDHTMYRFWDISWNRLQRSKLDLSDLENDLQRYPRWFHTLHILGQDWFHKEATWCNKFGQHLINYWILSIIMGKLTKPDLSTLNPSLDSWLISSPRSCIQKK